MPMYTSRYKLENHTHIMRGLAGEANNIARRVCRHPCSYVEYRHVYESILMGLAMNEYNAMKAPWVAKIMDLAALTLPKYLYDRSGNVELLDDGMTPELRRAKSEYIAHIEAIRLEVFGPEP